MTGRLTAIQPLEVWAGVECTVNRVGDKYFDQLERNGHATRLTDLDLFAELGVKALRYPVLWERTAPHGVDSIEWSWVDERLEYLSRLGVRPIVGLIHHGSGPRYTNLTDAEFPAKLAEFAGAVARRHPSIDEYTPVNEPLTTAIFCGLYGHWYPHARDPLVFARAFLHQCRGIVLAMRAIRKENPDARLLQTEDLGKTFSTPKLSYQAEFENERRWLTFDLLSGLVTPGHAMWDYLQWLGIREDELEWFVDNPCVPDTLGINHYITSERFLDERMSRYPASAHGGNGRHAYADVEAVRVCAEGIAGPRTLIKEVWERYRSPIAITEVHLGCTREEQLRWFKTVWDAAKESRREMIDIRAVTVWSALGAYDWNSLLTRGDGHYEPGVFDLRSSEPRPTALARMIRKLARGNEYDHPTLDSPGWWHRFDRLCYPPVSRRRPVAAAGVRSINTQGQRSRPLLITGATGTLGKAFARICETRGLAYNLLSRQELDIADARSVAAALDSYEPWAVINAAGYVRVDDAEFEQEKCRRENVIGPELLAKACQANRISLLTFSSDLVFDGSKGFAYVESDSTSPLNVYGLSKAEAEQKVLGACPNALIVRSSAFFGPWDHFNFASAVLDALRKAARFPAASDVIVSPTYVPDLVHASLDLLIDGEHGLWHLANAGALSWADFARLLASEAGCDTTLVDDQANQSFGLPARRPANTPLRSERGILLPSLEDAVRSYVQEESQEPTVRREAQRLSMTSR
ncbi:MAG: family 1 glycosylhydrolase [Pyrinomonadaceae bacterium]